MDFIGLCSKLNLEFQNLCVKYSVIRLIFSLSMGSLAQFSLCVLKRGILYQPCIHTNAISHEDPVVRGLMHIHLQIMKDIFWYDPTLFSRYGSVNCYLLYFRQFLFDLHQVNVDLSILSTNESLGRCLKGKCLTFYAISSLQEFSHML